VLSASVLLIFVTIKHELRMDEGTWTFSKISKYDFDYQIIAGSSIREKTPDKKSIMRKYVIKSVGGQAGSVRKKAPLSYLENYRVLSLYHNEQQLDSFNELFGSVKKFETIERLKALISQNKQKGMENGQTLAVGIKLFFGDLVVQSTTASILANKQAVDTSENPRDSMKEEYLSTKRLFEGLETCIRSFGNLHSNKPEKIGPDKSNRQFKRKREYSYEELRLWRVRLREEFKPMQNKNCSVEKMYSILKYKFKELPNISKTTFFEKILKAEGYRFRKLKTKFGVLRSTKKMDSKIFTSIIIGELFKYSDCLYFYDESAFSMNDFTSKFWIHSPDADVVHLRNPTLRAKLNLIMSTERIVAFQLASETHSQNDVVRFVTKVMRREVSEDSGIHVKYLVLDNSPKNRRRDFLEKMEHENFCLLFITPGTRNTTCAKVCSWRSNGSSRG
jgi:hypothetical protein